jgi:cadmium resistance protein CadD (predicted permease)
MQSILVNIGIGIIVFVSTNIDDILLLSVFFADRQMSKYSIVIGQFLGIGLLVLGSAAAALLAIAIPEHWIAMLGLIPFALGVMKLFALRREGQSEVAQAEEIQRDEQSLARQWHSQTIAVAGVTIANGGDNVGVYSPLFAKSPASIIVFASTFAAMTAVWCILGYYLVSNRLAGQFISRYAHRMLPFVLIGLGIYILAGALPLFR